MPSYITRPNASKWDLGGGSVNRMDWYNDIFATVDTFGRFGRMPGKFSEALIVNLIMYYIDDCKFKGTEPSKEYAVECFTRYCDRSMTTFQRLANMLDGSEPLQFKADTNTTNRGYGNNTAFEAGAERRRASASIRSASNETVSVAAFLGDGKTGLTRAPEVHVGRGQRMPAGSMTKPRALKWLEDRGIDFERWDEYFQHIGVSDGQDIYQLLVKERE
jgi:hypothetical protein